MIYGQVRSQNGGCHVFVASEGLKGLNISYESWAGYWLRYGSQFWHGLCFESHYRPKSMKRRICEGTLWYGLNLCAWAIWEVHVDDM